MTERLHFHFSLSCIREGNGNPLQYSCLENPRDGGAWWAAVYGVAQSRTQLKQLSSSSSSDPEVSEAVFIFFLPFLYSALLQLFAPFYLSCFCLSYSATGSLYCIFLFQLLCYSLLNVYFLFLLGPC